MYTLSPTFRAEPSHSRFHLAEFLMLEAESVHMTNTADLCNEVEAIVRDITSPLLDLLLSTGHARVSCFVWYFLSCPDTLCFSLACYPQIPLLGSGAPCEVKPCLQGTHLLCSYTQKPCRIADQQPFKLCACIHSTSSIACLFISGHASIPPPLFTRFLFNCNFYPHIL